LPLKIQLTLDAAIRPALFFSNRIGENIRGEEYNNSTEPIVIPVIFSSFTNIDGREIFHW